MSYKWLKANPPPKKNNPNDLQSLNEKIKSGMLSYHLEIYQYQKDGGSSNNNKIMVKIISQKL